MLQMLTVVKKRKRFSTARKRSLGQGNVFTHVCLSVHGGGVLLGETPSYPLDRDLPALDRDPLDRYPLNREPLDRDPWMETPWTENPSGQRLPLDRDSSGQRLPWTETPLGRAPLGREPLGRGPRK